MNITYTVLTVFFIGHHYDAIYALIIGETMGCGCAPVDSGGGRWIEFYREERNVDRQRNA